MVGTGVFTSLGFQLLDISSHFALMMLWLVGGVTALCGALTYAELGARLPRSGGEYNFLSQIYHPALGFISGWISVTVGFAAPIALAAMTFEAYLGGVLEVPIAGLPAVLLILALAILHGFSHRTSSDTQVSFTAIKLVVILAFCAAIFVFADYQPVSLVPTAGDFPILLGGAFAVSLIYVNYAYTGWNAATYVLDELPDPGRVLPRVLVTGTLVVMGLYLLLNFSFLLAAPMDAMRGEIEIGVIAATAVFGETGGRIMGGLLALLLVSTVSAMVLAGPRVLAVVGQDFRAFSLLSRTNADGVPFVAIAVVAGLAVTFVLTSTFESILVFSGFALAANTLLAVAGVFVLRARDGAVETGYHIPAFPLPPLVYLGITLWTLGYILTTRPAEGLAALGMIASGGVLYLVTSRFSRS